MKKLTKKIMALMLSLVMILGCVPSFINEASANDNFNPILKIIVDNNLTRTVPAGTLPEDISFAFIYGNSLAYLNGLIEGTDYVKPSTIEGWSTQGALPVGEQTLKLTFPKVTSGVDYDNQWFSISSSFYNVASWGATHDLYEKSTNATTEDQKFYFDNDNNLVVNTKIKVLDTSVKTLEITMDDLDIGNNTIKFPTIKNYSLNFHDADIVPDCVWIDKVDGNSTKFDYETQDWTYEVEDDAKYKVTIAYSSVDRNGFIAKEIESIKFNNRVLYPYRNANRDLDGFLCWYDNAGRQVMNITVFYDFNLPKEPIKSFTLGTEGDLAVGLDATLDVTVPDGSNYTSTTHDKTGWYDNSNLSGSPVTNLTSRKKYYKKILLKGRAGYEFTNTTKRVDSIPGVTIEDQGLEGNKYYILISKFADGQSNVTFENLEDGKKVGEVTTTNYSLEGNDDNLYENQDCPKASDEYIKIYAENGNSPLSTDTELEKEQNYRIEVEVNSISDFVYDSDVELTLDKLTSLDDSLGNSLNKFNNVVTINDAAPEKTWFVTEPKLELDGNKLIFKAKLETKYINNILLDGEGEFNAGSKSTYSYKPAGDTNFHVDQVDWFTDEDCNTPLGAETNLSSTDTYYAKVVVKPNDGYYIATKTNYNPTIAVYDGVVKKYVSHDKDSLTCIIAKQTSKSTKLELATINDKTDIITIASKIDGPDEGSYLKLTPKLSDSVKIGIMPISSYTSRIGEYLVTVEMDNIDWYDDDENLDLSQEIATSSINSVEYDNQSYRVWDSPLEATGYTKDIKYEEYPQYYNKIVDYLKENKVLAVTNTSSLGYDSTFNYNHLPKEPQSASIYQFYDFGKSGNITFSGLTVGNEVKNISASGNIGTDESVTSGVCKVYVLEDGDYTEITNVDGKKLESGKDYKIKFYIENDKYDINKLTINGQNVPFTTSDDYLSETGCAVAGNGLTQEIYITYKFTPQSSSGGGSKTYKAKDDKDTTEKITGSGKKGSKRIVTPEQNRKVESVIVTDKDGNRYEVTNEGDGTYSFIQPGKDVTVEVKYKNRLIELTIGSLDASVDDVHHKLDVVPKVVNDRTMLPIRFVAENLGAKVDWDEKDPDTVIITRGDTKIEITLGSDIAKVNGKEYKLDSVAFAENDRTYLPVRFVSEKLNAIVEWNEERPMDVKIYERQ